MGSTTSLLKSAASTRKKLQAQQDAEVAFEWENSMQTYDEYVTYSKYLEDRQKGSTDPGDSLSYEKKLRSARRSYTSNEIQRKQMAIMEGAAGTQDKLDLIRTLYYQAYDNGDYNLSQNLLSQWDSLSIKFQNEQETAAKAFASSSAKAKNDFVKDLTNGASNVTLPGGKTVTPLALITDKFKETGDTNRAMEAAQETIDAIVGALTTQYESATTQDEVDKLEEKYGAGLSKIYETLTVDIGGKKLTAQQIVNGIASDKMNNPQYGLQAQYNEATGKTDYKLKENNIESIDYVRQINLQTGQEEYLPINVRTDQNSIFFGQSDQGRGLGTQLTNNGEVIGDQGKINLGTGTVERNDSQTIVNRLKNLGVVARQDGTTMLIKLPGENVERRATIQPDGSIRYIGDGGQIYEFGVVDKNLNTKDGVVKMSAGQVRPVAPDEISDFNTKSLFGGNISQASGAGNRYLADITGQTKSPTKVVKGTINIGNNFSGFGTALGSSGLQGSTGLLQTANMTRDQIERENEKNRLALQATSTPNLNQTPVRQYASNGVQVTQLKVAPAAPTPQVVVAAPAPQKKVTVVKPTAAPRVTVQPRTYTASNRPSF